MFGLAVHETLHMHEETKERATNEARINFKKDQALRHWVASHGGVYVPVDAQTPPSKYLSNEPERDIQTPSGRHLTLMNPAYVVRQMSELYAELYGIGGHITSLKLLRPENAADDWEKKALESLAQKGSEVKEFTNIKGEPFLRFMQPMLITQPCLKCHGHQGYKVGDIRGGVSVSIPMAEYLAREGHERLTHLIAYVLLWFTGLTIIWLGGRKLLYSMQERDQAHEELLKYKHYLEETVESRTVELTAANQKLKYLSLTDGLTNIANRRYFDELIHKEWQRALRKASPIALIMVDIDYFKLFNDSYGHQSGDECLKKVAMALNVEMKRSGDFVARYGGEEFAVVLPDTELAGALAIAENMSRNVANLQIEHADSDVSDHVTISLGVTSVIPVQNLDVGCLVQQADKALYAAKEQGRNQIRFFSSKALAGKRACETPK